MPKIAESVAPLHAHEQDGIERRASERYPSQAEASCHSAVASNITPFPTRVQNVSTSGIALVLGRRFEPGTLLGINVADPATDYECTLLAQVVRVVVERAFVLKLQMLFKAGFDDSPNISFLNIAQSSAFP